MNQRIGLRRPPPGMSWLDVLAGCGRDERLALLHSLADDLGVNAGDLAKAMPKDWRFVARSEQLPPEGDWSVWLALAGRGWGKTRVGAEALISAVRDDETRGTGVVAATAEDLRRYCLRGPSGVLTVAPESFRPKHEPGNTRLVWPNGLETLLFTAERPDRLRGPNLGFLWCDEVAAWKYLEETWDNAEFTMRDAENPRFVVTTTPKPRALLRQMLKDDSVAVTSGSTFQNAANLSPKFLRRLVKRYSGTSLGRQEIHAELLEEAEGAVWRRSWIDSFREDPSDPPEYAVSAVAVDPAATDSEESDETGIASGGRCPDGRFHLDEDLSGRYSPDGWARRAIYAYFSLPDPDLATTLGEARATAVNRRRGARPARNSLVVERNNGGDMCAATLQTTAEAMHAAGLTPTRHVNVVTVWASQGKRARAEPVAALYEQGRASHVGQFQDLEDEMCNWEPDSGMRSPSRLDAAVWLGTHLVLGSAVEAWKPGQATTVGKQLEALGEVGVFSTPGHSSGFPGLTDEHGLYDPGGDL